jgi:hypothetical protein
MNQSLQFLDAMAAAGAGEFETLSGRRRRAIYRKIIPEGHEAGKNPHDNGPEPFLAPDGVDEHPDLENKNRSPKRVAEPPEQIMPNVTHFDPPRHTREGRGRLLNTSDTASGQQGRTPRNCALNICGKLALLMAQIEP